eukprot:993844-Rhodomonas_salina.1
MPVAKRIMMIQVEAASDSEAEPGLKSDMPHSGWLRVECPSAPLAGLQCPVCGVLRDLNCKVHAAMLPSLADRRYCTSGG